MKLNFICCSESGSLDRDSNRISLFNILSSITIPINRFPATLLKLTIGFSVELEENEPRSQIVNIEISSSDFSVADKLAVEFGAFTTFHGLVRVNNIMIPKPGDIRVRITQDTKQLGEASCKILLGPAIEEPTMPAAAPLKDTSLPAKSERSSKRRRSTS